MRGQATPTTPAKSVGLNVFHGVRAPVWTSRRETGHEVSPRRPISNVFPSLVQRKGVSPDCEPCIGCGSPPSIGTKAIPSLVTAATRLPSGEREWACVPKLKPSGGDGTRLPAIQIHDVHSRCVPRFVTLKEEAFGIREELTAAGNNVAGVESSLLSYASG